MKLLLLATLLYSSFAFAKIPLFAEFEVHIPKSLKKKPSLLVVLHGCKQSANDIAAISKFNDLADKEGFIVLYPQQRSMRNGYMCWNWFSSSNQKRKGDETQEIAQLTKHFIEEYKVNKKNVFITGISAGGAMAALLATYYPEVYSAVAIHSGVSFVRADTASKALRLMKHGPENLPRVVQTPKNEVPTFVIQGTEDPFVNPNNVDALKEDFTPTNTSHYQELIIDGLGHAWSGGTAGYDFSDPNTVSATQAIWKFFKRFITSKCVNELN